MDLPQEFIYIILGATCAFQITALVIYVFFLLTLRKALSRVSPSNRLMEPEEIWVLLVPCLNVIWMFVVATCLPDSLYNEYLERGRDDDSDYGKTVGLAFCVLILPGYFVGMLVFTTTGSQLLASAIHLSILFAALICFVTFWVKISRYSGMLQAHDSERHLRINKFDEDNDRSRDSGSPPSDAIQEGEPGNLDERIKGGGKSNQPRP